MQFIVNKCTNVTHRTIVQEDREQTAPLGLIQWLSENYET